MAWERGRVISEVVFGVVVVFGTYVLLDLPHQVFEDVLANDGRLSDERMAWVHLSLSLGAWIVVLAIANTRNRYGSVWVVGSTLVLAASWTLAPLFGIHAFYLLFLYLVLGFYGMKGGLRSLSFDLPSETSP